MSDQLAQQVASLLSTLVGNWQYFTDGCFGGVFLELAVFGGINRLAHARIDRKPAAALYSIACIIGGGLYASRFLGASSDYAAMVEGFSFPVTLAALAGSKPEKALVAPSPSAPHQERRERAREQLRDRVRKSDEPQ